MTFSERTFRDALGLFPTGVAVVTTVAADGTRLGATVSSFNSVSLDPPLVLFSVARNAKAFPVWAEADRYAVNLLREEQSALSTRFARPMSDKWDNLEPVEQDGLILLPNTLAWFGCEAHARFDGGDHLILVGRVSAFAVASGAQARPLVFFKGRYRQLDPDQDIETPQGLDHLLHGW